MKAAAAGIYGESSECPVCGMAVDITKAKAAGLTSEFRGQTYYFCADEDKVKFDKEPTRYAWKAAKGAITDAGKRLEQVEWSAAHSVEPAHAGHMPPMTPTAGTLDAKR
jgi:YHS domain-containing protein